MQELVEWFLKAKRVFPWRENPTPYGVWISEVMLQQTRASVVVDYYNRWMKQFPTISALAKAPIEEVLKAWEGLGYYSRARNLHEAARSLSSGELPSTLEELLRIKGVGAYTAGAILSFAFHQKAAAVDGNVARVVSRYFGLEEDLTKSKSKALLVSYTLSLLPDVEPWISMEALIELGATLCSPRPSCAKCPMASTCTAHLEGKTGDIPFKKKRQKTVHLSKQVLVILHGEEVLLEVRREGDLLGGLAQFPAFPYLEEVDLELRLEWQEDLPKQKQSFTIYQEELFPAVYIALEKRETPPFRWHKVEDLETLVFSSGHRRILKDLLELGFEVVM